MERRTRLFYEFGPFRVDARERVLLREGQVVPLTPKLFDILIVLLQNSGRILSKDEIISLVWRDTVVEEGNLTRNISRLRRILGESRNHHPYIETVPWRGYGFATTVKEVGQRAAAPAIESIAVLPFINVSGDPEADYLSDGITESLINILSQLPHLKVMSRNSVFRYKGREADAQAVGRELKVSAVLTGSILPHSETLVISTELVDAQDNRRLWGERYNRKLTNIYQLGEAISLEIAGTLRLRLTGEERQRLTTRHSATPEAYRRYLRGRFYFHKLTPDGMQKGIDYLQQAIETDPNYAMAFAALTDCYNYLGNPAEAKKTAMRALELDEKLGEARASLAFFRFIYDWDFEEAEREFQRALEMSPNYAEAHHWYAIFLANMDRHEEAIAEAKRAEELDPISLLMSMTPGLALFCAHAFDQAVEEFQKVLDMDPNFMPARSLLGHTYEQKGLYEEAIAEYLKVSEGAGRNAVVESAIRAVIGRIHAKCGRRSQALEILNEVSEPNEAVAHSGAEIYAALGEKDQAFACLEKLYETRAPQLVSLKINPNLTSLRTDPRFSELLRRIGLPQ
jgi:TolB-like protein/Tfp pilus assembly protein PilF